jgi:hypothetical protein
MFFYFGEKLIDWVISRATSNDDTVNLELYGQLEPVPILGMLFISAGLYFASQYLFARKEMK